MIKNIINRTIVNYILVAIGTFLVSKSWIPADLWDVFSSGAEEVILVIAGGGGLAAAVIGAARGIIESQKDKVVINGERAELPANVSMSAKTAADRLVGRASDGARL